MRVRIIGNINQTRRQRAAQERQAYFDAQVPTHGRAAAGVGAAVPAENANTTAGAAAEAEAEDAGANANADADANANTGDQAMDPTA